MLKPLTKTLIVFSITYLSLSMFSGLAHAKLTDELELRRQSRDEARERRVTDLEERKMERTQAREERLSERCENIKERVSARISRMEGNKAVHVANYNRLGEKLEEIIVFLNENGVDTSELETDLATLDEMINDYAETYSTFIDSLQSDNETDCDSLEGGKREALNAAKDHLQELISKRQAIREFYRTEIREQLHDLRLQLVSANTDAEEGESNE